MQTGAIPLERRPGEWAAARLSKDEGLPYAEVAAVLGVPESTARSLVHRGLRRVATELDRTEVRR